jgi:hypothetical protein
MYRLQTLFADGSEIGCYEEDVLVIVVISLFSTAERKSSMLVEPPLSIPGMPSIWITKFLKMSKRILMTLKN